MSTFFEGLLKYSDLFVVGGVIGTALLVVQMKKRIALIIVMLTVLIGGVYLYDQMKYTTFDQLFSKQLNEESTVRKISITIDDLSGGVAERKASVTIEDEVIIQKILDDFSSMELKKVNNHGGVYMEYSISILTSNPKGTMLVTDSIGFDLDHNYLRGYEIVSETDHLKTIEALVESDEVEWKASGE